MTLVCAPVVDKIIRGFAHPVCIIVFPAACALALWRIDVNDVTLILSVLAITVTQLVLLSQVQAQFRADARDKAMHAKLDGIIDGTNAPNELKGIERD